ncbi:hypothetical protein [Cedecea colo]|uniref:Uncharacterized protein n=1 Tax=Cedecea colo TaxID=2552946 RepID=A0ABX0VL53_9ENTR|nr:hypothetical protein [Cedecea colo]NIY47310.1 hypothetical protein [Cedecea colo]
MSKKTGGAAFPGLDYYRSKPLPQEAQGMTLRDYFAAKVINGILSDPNAGLLDDDLSRYARIAFKAADAMLKARSE